MRLSKGFVSIVKTLLFYCLLYLRGLFFIACKFLSFFALLGAVVTFFIGNNQWMVVGCIGVSFGIFLLRQCYDSILLKLTPPGQEYILAQ